MKEEKLFHAHIHLKSVLVCTSLLELHNTNDHIKDSVRLHRENLFELKEEVRRKSQLLALWEQWEDNYRF